MEFKKYKLSTKHFLGLKKQSNFISNIVGLFSIIVIFFIGALLTKNIKFISFDFVKKIVLETEAQAQVEKKSGLETEIDDNSLIKDNIYNLDITNISNITDISNKIINASDILKFNSKTVKPNTYNNEKINILLIGRGGGLHEAPNLTDTIIFFSINTKNKTITLLSIPRDLYVNYEDGTDGKINNIFVNYGIKALEKKVTQITNEKIDFFVNVDFNGFTKILDTIGGIEIEVQNNFVDTQYPNGKGGYSTLIFRKGKWLFDGENALKYARSRHSTSDFDRSLRQQQVIKGVKDKLLRGSFLMSPTKIKDLYDIFIKYIYTDLKLKDIIKISYLLTISKDYKILSFNLNDSCFYGSEVCQKGGFLYIPNRDLFSGMSVLLLEGTDKSQLNNYNVIHKYSDLIFNYSDVFKENYKINVFNSLKVNLLAGSLANSIKKYGLNIPEKLSIGNIKNIREKSIIYYNNINENSVTIKALKNLCNVEFKKVDGPLYSNDSDTKIEIVIGKDYIDEVNEGKIFKF